MDPKPVRLPALSPQPSAPFPFIAWIDSVLREAFLEYAVKKSPRDRFPQNGQALRQFTNHFGRIAPGQLRGVLDRLTEEAGFRPYSLALLLNHALAQLSVEVARGDFRCVHDHHRALRRWCEWLDARVHLRIHEACRRLPFLFHGDSDTRWLASLGFRQRHFSSLSGNEQLACCREIAHAAVRFPGSPRWHAFRAGFACRPATWNYPDVDRLVISFWPLVKAHNWTHHELLQVLRWCGYLPDTKHSPFRRYPCDTDAAFAAYCVNVLGLRKSGRGRTRRSGLLPGARVAAELAGHPALYLCDPQADALVNEIGAT